MSREVRTGDPLPPQEPRVKFWTGADVKVGENITIPRGFGTVIPVLVGNGALPELDRLRFPNQKKFPDQVRELSVATRSRLAQLGLEVLENAGSRVAYFMRKRSAQFGMGQVFDAKVHVVNYGGRPIKLEKGMEFFRFYQPGQRIEGEELVSLVNSGILIEGKQGREWGYIHNGPYTKNNKDVTGIAVRITEGERYWIPPIPGPIPAIEVQDTGDYRSVLSQFYMPVPRNQMPGIWIGQTPRIILSDTVVGELDEEVAQSLALAGDIDRLSREKLYPYGRQIGARLIDPGTNWPVRVEIASPISQRQMPSFVVFRFMRANGVQVAA